jgi:hypothetical protein
MMRIDKLTAKVKEKLQDIINDVLHDTDTWQEVVGEWLKEQLEQRELSIEFGSDGVHFTLFMGDVNIETGAEFAGDPHDYSEEDVAEQIKGMDIFIRQLQERRELLAKYLQDASVDAA